MITKNRIKGARTREQFYAIMGWDQEHGPTEEQIESFRSRFPSLVSNLEVWL